MPPRKLFKRLLRREEGSIAVMTAASGGLMLVCAAAAVDLGSVYLQSRKLQGMADLAALSAARDLTAATAAAQATVEANHFGSAVAAAVQTGVYDQNPSKAADARFAAGAASPNAAEVQLSADADLFFGKAVMGKSTLKIRRRATALRAEYASFSIGSRLASLDGGAANILLSALAGGTVSLSVMDYDALADADVDLFDYASALRTTAALKGASFDEALAADLSTGQALSVLGDVLNAQGDVKAGAAAKKLAVAASGPDPAKLDSLFDLGPAGERDRLLAVKSGRVKLAAMDLADAVLLVAQEGRQVKLDFGAEFPGAANVDVWLAIGERPNNSPWLTMDGEGAVTVRTHQARLYVKAQTLSVLTMVGAKPITLPVLVEVASAEARLGSIQCPASPSASKVALQVRPSVGKLTIADIDTTELNDFKSELATSPATVVDLSIVKAKATASASVGGQAWQTVNFTRAEIEAGTLKAVKSTDIANASIATLLANTSVSATVLNIPTPSLGLSMLGSLKTLGAPLDGVINGLTQLLGVRLGEADVQINGLRCRDAVLVA